MPTPFQEHVAEIIAGLDEAEDFALAGGSALIARGKVQWTTSDLDLVGLTSRPSSRIVPAVDCALRVARSASTTLSSTQDSLGSWSRMAMNRPASISLST